MFERRDNPLNVTCAGADMACFYDANTLLAKLHFRPLRAKVDELMALCDRLEASLTATSDFRRRLLDALLAETLASSIAQEEAAA